MLDVGAFTAALEYAADIKAEVMGKPQPAYFHTALKDMGVDPSEVMRFFLVDLHDIFTYL